MNRFVTLVALVGACGGGTAKPAAVPPPAVTTPAPAPAATPAPSPIPETSAGKTLAAWLDAFNSADEARLDSFVTSSRFPLAAGELLQFRNQTGGFELLRIEKSESTAIKFVVKEKSSPTTAVGWLRVTDDAQPQVAGVEILAILPGMTSDQMALDIDAAGRRRVIDAAIAKLTELYVYPDVANKMAQALRDHDKAGDYESIREAPAFAKRLTQDLRAVRISTSPCSSC